MKKTTLLAWLLAMVFLSMPVLAACGEKEKAARVVAVRARGGQDLGQMSLDSLIERWRREIEAKAGSV